MTGRDERFEQLRAQYARSLADKRVALERAWRAFAAAPGDGCRQRELATLLHRLAGSAGAYGFDSVGVLAGEADRCLAGLPADGGSAGELETCVQGVLDALAKPIGGLPVA